jgi:cytoskeletal protein CcmA (bactofilin family)
MRMDRKQQEESPRPVPAPSRPEPPAPEASVGSAGRPAAADSRGIAVIGKGMIIKGQIRSAEHMHIAGEIDGSLYLAGYDLTATAECKVRANVTAREVDIAGSVQGNVDATRKITVRTGGRLIGDLRTPGIVIEDGAYFKGNIEIVTSESRQNGDETTQASPRTVTANA